MAGGYKLWSTGEVVTATNLQNYIQNQTVMVFTDSSARTTALSGVVAAGMISYLTGTNSLETYNGTTWTANGTGDVTTTGTQTLTNKTLTLPGDKVNVFQTIGNQTYTINRTTTLRADGITYLVRVRVNWPGNTNGVSSSLIVSRLDAYTS